MNQETSKNSSQDPVTRAYFDEHAVTKAYFDEVGVTKAYLEKTLTDYATRVEMEQLLADQAEVMLEAMDERMDKKFDEKLDPVINKLDSILGSMEALKEENVVGAKQLRRYDDQLQDHEARIKTLELHPHRTA